MLLRYMWEEEVAAVEIGVAEEAAADTWEAEEAAEAQEVRVWEEAAAVVLPSFIQVAL